MTVRVRWHGVFLTFGLLAFVGNGAHAAPPDGYTLAWSDEFHQGVGNRPDTTMWNFETGPSRVNQELETYVDDVAHAQIVSDPRATDGQALQILATNTHGYESARMTTQRKHEFQYGFIEARLQMPYGQGIWPAFWLLGANIGAVGWPSCGENDVMENIGKRSWWDTTQATLHSARNAGGPRSYATFDLSGQYKLPAGTFFKDGYHLFQCWWQPDSLSFYVDGQLFETRTRAEYQDHPWPFNAPMFFILNLAVGGGWPGNPDGTTVFPQKMLVDYVRVYTGTTRVPPTPRRLTAIPGTNGQVALWWSTDVSATSYHVYRSEERHGSPALLGEAMSGSYTDTSPRPGARYYYSIAAVNPAGESRPTKPTPVSPLPAAASASSNAAPKAPLPPG